MLEGLRAEHRTGTNVRRLVASISYGAGLRMQRNATNEEAAKLIAEFGEAAYARAREAERDARRRRNEKLAKFLDKVARRIEKDGK